ncbi:MAG: ROK family protein [Planctomycetaceae bacterium]
MGISSEDGFWVGFDLGGTKMLASVYDANLKQISRKRKRTKAHEGVESGLERIRQLIHTVIKEAEIQPEQISGIGIGCPGPLNLEKGIILEAPNLGWKNVPIVKMLKDEFGCPTIIANDVDLGVYGEATCGSAKSDRCVLGVFPGTGVGGGCVYEGQIIRGSKYSCMEIGHIPVINNGPICGCGLRGCLETVASRLAVASAAAAAAYRGQAPYLMSKVGTEVSEIRSSALAASIEAGDKAVRRIVENAAEYIGIAAATVIHLISPDVILLGGGLVEAMPNLFTEIVHRTAQSHVLPSYKDSFRVTVTKLGDDAAVTGAAAWARYNFQSTLVSSSS